MDPTLQHFDLKNMQPSAPVVKHVERSQRIDRTQDSECMDKENANRAREAVQSRRDTLAGIRHCTHAHDRYELPSMPMLGGTAKIKSKGGQWSRDF